MKILSFDTSNNLASVSISLDAQIIAYESTKQDSQQAEQLFNLINESLKQAKISLNDIDLVSITNGPGSFTGVRIALAAALGMELTLKAKFIAITNFQALAYYVREQSQTKKIATILDARRNQVYFQLFNSDLKEVSEPKLLDIENLLNYMPKNCIAIGDGIKFLPEFEEKFNFNVNAKILVQASNFYFKNKLYHELEPLYIREPEVSMPKK